MMTYIGMRMSLRIQWRVADTSPFDSVTTNIVAIPRPRPFTNVEVTASSGHSPSSCTRPGLSCQSPDTIRPFREC